MMTPFDASVRESPVRRRREYPRGLGSGSCVLCFQHVALDVGGLCRPFGADSGPKPVQPVQVGNEHSVRIGAFTKV